MWAVWPMWQYYIKVFIYFVLSCDIFPSFTLVIEGVDAWRKVVLGCAPLVLVVCMLVFNGWYSDYVLLFYIVQDIGFKDKYSDLEKNVIPYFYNQAVLLQWWRYSFAQWWPRHRKEKWQFCWMFHAPKNILLNWLIDLQRINWQLFCPTFFL